MLKTKVLITAALLISCACEAQKSNTKLIHSFTIGGTGGWDYLAVSPVHDQLYVSHSSRVNIINKLTGDSVGVIENTNGVHGIAFDKKNGKGFTSNGRSNSVTVFDLNTNKVITQIATGANPDAIMYEPYTKMIITCNGRSNNLSIIDPVSNLLIDSIAVPGRPETAVSNGSGMLYVNIEDKNLIAEVDLKSRKVINSWTLTPGDGPAGLAIDIKNKRLFSGCNKILIVLDATTGAIIDKITIGEGCDGVAFDPFTKNIYTANGEGNLTVIHEDNANKFTTIDNVATAKSARTIALDETTHQLYLPAADFEPLAPGEKGRAKMKAGTFRILVLDTVNK